MTVTRLSVHKDAEEPSSFLVKLHKTACLIRCGFKTVVQALSDAPRCPLGISSAGSEHPTLNNHSSLHEHAYDQLTTLS